MMVDMTAGNATEVVGLRTLLKLRKSHAALGLLHRLQTVEVKYGLALQVVKGNQKLPPGYGRFSFEDVPGLRNLDGGNKAALAEHLRMMFGARATRKFLLFDKPSLVKPELLAGIAGEAMTPFEA